VDYRDTASEADVQRVVVEAAELCGWLVAHHPDSRKAISAGLPDLILAHPSGRVAMWEIKSAKGRLRPAQRRWAEALIAGPVDYRVVRPATLADAVDWLQHPR